MAKLRRTRPEDRAALQALWAEVFGDPVDVTDLFFDSLYTPGEAAAALVGGTLASAGYCISGPVANGLKCAYIYAVATWPEFRGRGLAADVVRALADNAFADGADIVVTLPAEKSLCPWYERVLGMVPLFKKGGEGVVFPKPWHALSKDYGTFNPESDSPDRLYAVAAPGVDLTGLDALGWELCFE